MNINSNYIYNIQKQICIILFRIRKNWKSFLHKNEIDFLDYINLLHTSYDNSKLLKIFYLRKFWVFKAIFWNDPWKVSTSFTYEQKTTKFVKSISFKGIILKKMWNPFYHKNEIQKNQNRVLNQLFKEER